jgi:hypothetical protein
VTVNDRRRPKSARAGEYRDRAAACEQRASMDDEFGREFWLVMAAAWIRVAEGIQVVAEAGDRMRRGG